MAKKGKKRNGRKSITETPLSAEQLETVVSAAVASQLAPLQDDIDEIKGKMDDSDTVEVTKDDLDDMGVDTPEELIAVIEEGVEIAVENLETEGDLLAAEVADEGVDVEDIVTNLVKSRRKRKRKGEDLSPITPEDVADVIEEVAVDIADDLESGEAKAEDNPEDDEDNPDDGAKRKSSRGKKASTARRSTKKATSRRASTPARQRKYANILLDGANRGSKSIDGENAEPLTYAEFGRLVKCADYYARGGVGGGFADPERASHYAEKVYKDTKMAKAFKSMSATQSSTGGLLIPQDYHAGIVPLLYAKTVLFELGAQRMAMPHGNMTIVKQTEGTRATWGGEERDINPSTPDFGELRLSSKRLQAMLLVSDEMLRSTDYSQDAIYGRDLLVQMQLGIDYGGLLGDGQEFNPLGIMHNPKIKEYDLTTINDTLLADSDGRPTDELPIFARGIVLGKDVEGTSLGWTFNVDVEHYFMRLKYPNGEYVWRDEMLAGTFAGYPYKTTSQFKTSVDGYADMVFGNWSDLIVGEQFGLETMTSREATVNVNGKQVSTFQKVMNATRATTYADMGVRYDEAFVRFRKVKVVR